MNAKVSILYYQTYGQTEHLASGARDAVAETAVSLSSERRERELQPFTSRLVYACRALNA